MKKIILIYDGDASPIKDKDIMDKANKIITKALKSKKESVTIRFSNELFYHALRIVLLEEQQYWKDNIVYVQNRENGITTKLDRATTTENSAAEPNIISKTLFNIYELVNNVHKEYQKEL